jgi:hypothetical protein
MAAFAANMVSLHPAVRLFWALHVHTCWNYLFVLVLFPALLIIQERRLSRSSGALTVHLPGTAAAVSELMVVMRIARLI